jgi:hypothetical protein
MKKQRTKKARRNANRKPRNTRWEKIAAHSQSLMLTEAYLVSKGREAGFPEDVFRSANTQAGERRRPHIERMQDWLIAKARRAWRLRRR